MPTRNDAAQSDKKKRKKNIRVFIVATMGTIYKFVSLSLSTSNW